ncbi:hypothetical protein P9112_006741 [Eukaryota sp. TZLM1-RC]
MSSWIEQFDEDSQVGPPPSSKSVLRSSSTPVRLPTSLSHHTKSTPSLPSPRKLTLRKVGLPTPKLSRQPSILLQHSKTSTSSQPVLSQRSSSQPPLPVLLKRAQPSLQSPHIPKSKVTRTQSEEVTAKHQEAAITSLSKPTQPRERKTQLKEPFFSCFADLSALTIPKKVIYTDFAIHKLTSDLINSLEYLNTINLANLTDSDTFKVIQYLILNCEKDYSLLTVLGKFCSLDNLSILINSFNENRFPTLTFLNNLILYLIRKPCIEITVALCQIACFVICNIHFLNNVAGTDKEVEQILRKFFKILHLPRFSDPKDDNLFSTELIRLFFFSCNAHPKTKQRLTQHVLLLMKRVSSSDYENQMFFDLCFQFFKIQAPQLKDPCVTSDRTFIRGFFKSKGYDIVSLCQN